MSDWGIEDLDLDAYLRRIGVTEPTLETLHAGHVRSIPFESLDVLRGNVPALDIASLQAKLVRRQRGGYCFEHNLLYAAALERLGITVSRLLGRPMLGGPQAAPRTHMIVVAHQDDQPYLTDVGWGGGCLLEPMPLREGTMQQGKWTFRLSRHDEIWVLASLISGEWRDLYGFLTDRQYPADFAMANFYTARWPESPFANRVIAQTSSPQTRQTLNGTELAVISPQDGYLEKRTLTKDEVLEVLATRFGIDLSDTERDEVAARI
ncbi:N-hydroxyarylamine O-acetyltransferase [Kibdelosporangium banguiense]|uniref:N-hydroxyarylamine O-acetyltransferase n=1 Tax=Kibdelosporangium banguiense TaxID=1365924 RepID=A0ABS4U2T8_9PSEU|nr:arylamine N-acetyltransferase [Kibdelosporangium banguiense]MBP2330972.1 N-hydroxyarylamine O-acetyltransferase [Kibdelosporangium banguiense]